MSSRSIQPSIQMPRPLLAGVIAAMNLLLILPTVGVAGQLPEGPPAEVAEAADDQPAAPNSVEVTPDASDQEIADRLQSILDSSKRFESPQVSVVDGVVFLEGIAKEKEFKTWAGDLANNTQDVAAVINRMTLPEKSIWDFGPAWKELNELERSAVQAIPLVIFGIFVLVVTWFLARLAAFVANRVLRKTVPNDLLRWVASHAVMLPVLIFGAYLVLRVSGLTQLALTVLGGTGLIGLVIGIAFQDIAENFLASVLISVQSPFRKGDMVEIAEHSGIVQRVSTRGTTLMTLDGNLVQIPNSKVYKATILNYTASPERRISFDIGIGYDDPTSEAQQTVLEKVKQHEVTLDEPPPRVLIESLGASTVNLRVLFWIDGTKNEWQSVRSSVMRITKQALFNKGISMPDEAREVIFPHGVPVQMIQSDASVDMTPTNRQTSDDTERLAEDRVEMQTQRTEQPEELAGSEAEGHMQSETEDLEKQASKSWLPDAGSEIVIEGQ